VGDAAVEQAARSDTTAERAMPKRFMVGEV
jgi:hypothetical protein